MTLSLDELNRLPKSEAADLFRSCCGASQWVNLMVKGRPYKTVDSVLAAADTAWKAIGPEAWREAFSHHPRIGQTKGGAAQTDLAKKFSVSEQAKVRLASSSIHDQMSLVNTAYEATFGYIYITSATGKSAAELLGLARRRLRNDPETELGVASAEQQKITALRLRKLFDAET